MSEWVVWAYLAAFFVMFGFFAALIDDGDSFLYVVFCAALWPLTLACIAFLAACSALGWIGYKAGQAIKRGLS